MKTVKLTTEPFSCPSCVAKIERLLAQTPGVESSQVMFNSSKVKVTFDEEQTSAQQLADAVTKLGYPVLNIA
ncbi:heavy-metal-associated domain-containing protein [Scrofimicrobium sp. R131]|uniref:Heavy-metal-associated domain-containing protein n=1 Tax=Scrofimicrobium appendicitidis TaxID=3079930 RepID=A0AAU7V6U1_9ACTO